MHDGACSTVPPDDDGCGGLACPTCAEYLGDHQNGSPGKFADYLCITAATCAGVYECPARPGYCDSNLGTHTIDFTVVACVNGLCAYHPTSNGCVDGTSCEECSAQEDPSCSSVQSASDCARCCGTTHSGSANTHVFPLCACGSDGPCASICGGSAFCGGSGDESDDCARCLGNSLFGDGAYAQSGAFRDACIHGMGDEGGPDCSRLAQCLATCAFL